jgi:uncharacterized protein YndB with AHSA1/START domain
VTEKPTEPVTGSATTTIAAPISAVFAAVADVTRMGEWSPECVACRWVGDGTGPAVVTESYSFPSFGGWQNLVYGRLLNRPKAMAKGMQATLDRIKQSLET